MNDNDLHDLKFYIERSCRYHSRREAWFDTLHKLTMGISLLAGSSAFAAFFATKLPPQLEDVGGWASAIVAILTTTNLVIGFSHRARDHQVLYRRFKQLAIEIIEQKISGKLAPDEIERKKLSIEIDEPPVYRALDASCFNEVIKSMSSNSDYVFKHSISLGLRHKVFMHLFRFSDNDFRPRGEASLEPRQVA